MKLFCSDKPCRRCKRKFRLKLNDHIMCVGCNFKTKERTFKSFTLNGWTFFDTENGIEVALKEAEVIDFETRKVAS